MQKQKPQCDQSYKTESSTSASSAEAVAQSGLDTPECVEMIACGVYDDDPDRIEHHDKACPAYKVPEQNPISEPYEDLARAVIKRLTTSAIRLAIMRHGLCDDAGDPLDLTTEDEIIEDVIDCMTGDETGCNDPEDLDASNCGLIYLVEILGAEHHAYALALASELDTSTPSSAEQP